MLEKEQSISELHNEEMFRLLVSSIQDYAIFMLDPQGHVISWNDGAERIIGFKRSEIIGKHFSVFIPPEDVERGKLGLELESALNDGRFEDIGWRLRKDGTRFWANVVLTPVRDHMGILQGFAKITRDLTERKKAEEIQQSVIRSNAEADSFSLLADASPYLVWSCDPDGNCTYVNQRWREYTGQTETQALEFGWLEVIHPEDRESTLKSWKHSVVTQGSFSTDFRIRNVAGEYRWFNSRGLPHRNSQNEVARWVGACTDIDDNKRAAELLERNVRERTAQLEQANRDLQLARDRALEASSVKSKFVANISHEIRTPMSGVLGMSELLLTCDLDTEARELAQYIYSSARSLLDVVNDLLDFSKLEAGKLSITRMRFNIEKVVSEVAKTTALSANQKNLRLAVNIENDLPEVYGDAGRVRQVLLNLVHNAIKFTNRGGVTIAVSCTNRSKNAVTIRFAVTDTGIGIAPEAREHLFNPFEQADGSTTRKYGGSGLGLSISRSLVQLMLGDIGFESEEGTGSTFWFHIPLELA